MTAARDRSKAGSRTSVTGNQTEQRFQRVVIQHRCREHGRKHEGVPHLEGNTGAMASVAVEEASHAVCQVHARNRKSRYRWLQPQAGDVQQRLHHPFGSESPCDGIVGPLLERAQPRQPQCAASCRQVEQKKQFEAEVASSIAMPEVCSLVGEYDSTLPRWESLQETTGKQNQRLEESASQSDRN
jgi:hypothetical protein